MKRLILIVFILLLLAKGSYADTSFTILAKQIKKTSRGDILLIFTEHKEDGYIIPSKEPSILEKINYLGYPISLVGKEYRVTSYSHIDFSGLSAEEREAYVLNDIDKESKNILQEIFEEKSGLSQKNINDIKMKNICDNDFKDLVGKSGVNKTNTIKIDSNVDGIYDTDWVIKTDGTNIIPIAIVTDKIME